MRIIRSSLRGPGRLDTPVLDRARFRPDSSGNGTDLQEDHVETTSSGSDEDEELLTKEERDTKNTSSSSSENGDESSSDSDQNTTQNKSKGRSRRNRQARHRKIVCRDEHSRDASKQLSKDSSMLQITDQTLELTPAKPRDLQVALPATANVGGVEVGIEAVADDTQVVISKQAGKFQRILRPNDGIVGEDFDLSVLGKKLEWELPEGVTGTQVLATLKQPLPVYMQNGAKVVRVVMHNFYRCLCDFIAAKNTRSADLTLVAADKDFKAVNPDRHVTFKAVCDLADKKKQNPWRFEFKLGQKFLGIEPHCLLVTVMRRISSYLSSDQADPQFKVAVEITMGCKVPMEPHWKREKRERYQSRRKRLERNAKIAASLLGSDPRDGGNLEGSMPDDRPDVDFEDNDFNQEQAPLRKRRSQQRRNKADASQIQDDRPDVDFEENDFHDDVQEPRKKRAVRQRLKKVHDLNIPDDASQGKEAQGARPVNGLAKRKRQRPQKNVNTTAIVPAETTPSPALLQAGTGLRDLAAFSHVLGTPNSTAAEPGAIVVANQTGTVHSRQIDAGLTIADTTSEHEGIIVAVTTPNTSVAAGHVRRSTIDDAGPSNLVDNTQIVHARRKGRRVMIMDIEDDPDDVHDNSTQQPTHTQEDQQQQQEQQLVVVDVSHDDSTHLINHELVTMQNMIHAVDVHQVADVPSFQATSTQHQQSQQEAQQKEEQEIQQQATDVVKSKGRFTREGTQLSSVQMQQKQQRLSSRQDALKSECDKACKDTGPCTPMKQELIPDYVKKGVELTGQIHHVDNPNEQQEILHQQPKQKRRRLQKHADPFRSTAQSRKRCVKQHIKAIMSWASRQRLKTEDALRK